MLTTDLPDLVNKSSSNELADADKTTEAKEVLEVVVRRIFKAWSCQRLPKQNTVQAKHFFY